MRARSIKKRSVKVVTLGCSKNLVDSELLMGQLQSNAFVVAQDENENSETVIINTCGFIESAKQESIDTILQYLEVKNNGGIEKLYVTGCLSQRYGAELKNEISGVDGWFGTRDLPQLLKTLKADYKKELVGERLLTTPRHFAYLKIAEGCDRPCSFCAIPLMRGQHLSVPIEDLVTQTQALAGKGVKELILIAQDLTFYGLDLYKRRSLADLLDKLSQVKRIEWIRLHYAFPGGFPLEVLDAMNRHENICKYLDMPLQHISDAVLKRMKRGITKEKTLELIEKIREKVPNIALRTTLMTGFPGETLKEHEEMLHWIEETKFDRLGVFTYSAENGTTAFSLTDDVLDKEKKRRADAVMELQRTISLTNNEIKIGKTFKTLIDREEGGLWVGRTEFDSPDVDNEVWISPPFSMDCKPGEFVQVKVNSATEFDLCGSIIHTV